jgi:hypothetical protein
MATIFPRLGKCTILLLKKAMKERKKAHFICLPLLKRSFIFLLYDCGEDKES